MEFYRLFLTAILVLSFGFSAVQAEKSSIIVETREERVEEESNEECDCLLSRNTPYVLILDILLFHKRDPVISRFYTQNPHTLRIERSPPLQSFFV